jgi:hypothetical protein
MSISKVHAIGLAVAIGAVGCAQEAAPEPQGSTHSNLAGNTSPGICGLANNQVLTKKPDQYLCTEGMPSEVTGDGIWQWTCGTQAKCTAYASSISYFDPARDQRGDFIRTVYKKIFGYDIGDDTYDYWVAAYNPGGGVGCRGIVQAFLVASPARGQAAAATSATDATLTTYIEMLYAALLPNFGADNTTEIAGWRQDGYLTMDQLDAIFLDDPEMKSRCAAAGMQF